MAQYDYLSATQVPQIAKKAHIYIVGHITNMYNTTGYYVFPCYMCALWWGLSALKYWYPCIQSKGASTPKIKQLMFLDKRIAGKDDPVWSLKGHRALTITKNVHLFILWHIYDNLAVNSFSYFTYRCNRLRCPLARVSSLQCYNMGHNSRGINLYGVIMTLMGNKHAGWQSSLGHLSLLHRYVSTVMRSSCAGTLVPHDSA